MSPLLMICTFYRRVIKAVEENSWKVSS